MGLCASQESVKKQEQREKEVDAGQKRNDSQERNHESKEHVRSFEPRQEVTGTQGGYDEPYERKHEERKEPIQNQDRYAMRPPRNHPQDKFIPASIQKATPGGRRNKPAPKKYTFSGDKYSYQADKEKWLKIPMKVAIERKPFNEGGMRLVYRCEEIDEKDNSRILSCAKVFKDGEGAQAYFDEAMTQMVAESYAQEFNRECAKKGLAYNVGFVPVSVLHLKTNEGRRLIYNVEPMLKGHYLKHNDNDGHVETNLLLPQAFSHYTHERSNNLLVVVDIQGVGSFYTDPQIHSFDGEGFGLGNMGQDGLTKFLKTHNCNDICRLLGLPAVTVKETDYEMARRLQEEEMKGAKPRKNSLMLTSVRYKKQKEELLQQFRSGT